MLIGILTAVALLWLIGIPSVGSWLQEQWVVPSKPTALNKLRPLVQYLWPLVLLGLLFAVIVYYVCALVFPEEFMERTDKRAESK